MDGELAGTESLRVREHLDGCPLCRAEHQSLVATKRLVASLSVSEPRSGFEQELIQRIRSASLEPAWRRWTPGALALAPRPTQIRLAAAFAAISLIMLALSIRLSLLHNADPNSVSALRATIAQSQDGPLPPADIQFVHETWSRPQPVSAWDGPPSGGDSSGNARVRPLGAWQRTTAASPPR